MNIYIEMLFSKFIYHCFCSNRVQINKIAFQHT